MLKYEKFYKKLKIFYLQIYIIGLRVVIAEIEVEKCIIIIIKKFFLKEYNTGDNGE